MAVFTSIQIKLVVIVLISTGLAATSNYNKWEFKRCTTGHFKFTDGLVKNFLHR